MIGPIARQRRKGDLILWTPAGRAVLDALMIRTIDDAEMCDLGTVVSAGTKRRVRRIDLPGFGVVFLKVATGGGTRHVVRELLRRGRRRSSSRIEFENAVELRGMGLPVAEPLASGERLRGLREEISFVISRGVPGRSLEEIVGVAGGDHRGQDLSSRLADFVRSFIRAGRYPKDLVAKHVFLDDEGRDHLIDVYALDRGAPDDLGKGCESIARLAASVRTGDVAAFPVQAFMRSVFGRRGSAALARVRREVEELMKDRRHRRFVVVGDRTRRAVAWKRSASDRFFVDPRYSDWFDERGFGSDAVPDDAEIERLVADDRTIRLRRSDELSARRVFNAYHACASQMPAAPIMAIRIESGARSSWFMVDRGHATSFLEAVASDEGADQQARVQDALRRLASLLDSGYAPADRITDWLDVESGTVRMVFSPEIVAVEPDRATARWGRLLARFSTELDVARIASVGRLLSDVRAEGWPPRRLLASGPIR